MPKVKLLLATIAIVGIAVACVNYSQVFASSAWSSGTFLLGQEEPHSSASRCENRTMPIVGIGGVPETANICVYERPNWRYANYAKRIDLGYMTTYEYYFVVGFGSESTMYVVGNMSGQRRPVEMPGSNDLVFNSPMWGYINSHELTVIKDFPSHLTLGYDGPALSKRFTLKDGVEQPVIPNSSGGAVSTGAMSISANGRWIAAEDRVTGFLLIDTETYRINWFSNYKHRYGVGADAHIKFVISDDGQYVATFDYNIEPKIYTLGSGCMIETDQYADAFVTQTQSAEPCTDDGGRMRAALETRFSASEVRSMEADRFSDDGGVLYFLRYDFGDDPASMDVKTLDIPLLSSGYTLSPIRLDYLALGDSYSSGEGDTERDKRTGKKYYRDFTDNEENPSLNQPREKCHISTRSYPYILSKGMSLGEPTNDFSTKWQSVACSGARISDVHKDDGGTYGGQGKGSSKIWDDGNIPRLRGYDIEAKQATALNEFIPGRKRQVEFVEKYKPKVITLTIGGNDIGFGAKLEDCLTGTATCRIATNDGKVDLAKEIRDQYDDLVPFYKKLHQASGGIAKIFVLGYPHFINGDSYAQCDLNAGLLNDEERKAIHASVEYLNNVIEQAAEAAGVEYIDIENSLQNGRLCDASQVYMTGVSMGGASERQESFHPNAKGNYQVAMKLWEEVGHESLLNYDICPNSTENRCENEAATKDGIVAPPFFQVTEPGHEVEHVSDMTYGSVTKGEPVDVTRAAYTYSPGSLVEFIVFSNPISLGSYQVSDDGSLKAELQIPNSIPAGYHTLIADGMTYSGEPVRYEQTVLVRGSDSGDIDENGVPDSQQVCGPFMATSGSDADLDGVDDVCDPQINDTPEIYRWRMGYTGRSYGGNPEEENQVYIERNIWASSRTGVSGDYDPDEDGWAIVGASQEDQLGGVNLEDMSSTVEFEVIGDGSESSPYSPIVYVRPNTQQCRAYRPTSLSRVAAEDLRTLSIAEISNERCPQELPDDNNPQEPEDSPKNEEIFDRLRNVLQAIKVKINNVINAVLVQLRTIFMPMRW